MTYSLPLYRTAKIGPTIWRALHEMKVWCMLTGHEGALEHGTSTHRVQFSSIAALFFFGFP